MSKLPPLEALNDLRKRHYVVRRQLPPPVTENLTQEQGGCVAQIVAAASNLSYATAKLVDLKLPLPEKKLRVVKALEARASELEAAVMGHFTTDEAEVAMKTGDAYLALCSTLSYLNGHEIKQVVEYAAHLADLEDEGREATVGTNPTVETTIDFLISENLNEENKQPMMVAQIYPAWDEAPTQSVWFQYEQALALQRVLSAFLSLPQHGAISGSEKEWNS